MQAQDTDLDLATNDLGPLAWVLDELRKSLESASSALRRFVRDASAARGQDMASVDAGQLRIARQHMHQAVGALEMVGLGAPAHMLRAMESAVAKFVERPELCNEAASAKVERAGFALTEYLEVLLLGKPVSPVALFPQYKDVQELAGSDRIHPADLWITDWKWVEPQTPAVAQQLVYDPAVRARMDQAVLRIVKAADPAAGRELADACVALAASQTAKQPKVFWKIAAGYFEAVANSLLPADIYVKRAASRVLLQYASLAKGELGVSDRLAQDLVFFCAQAVPANPIAAPILAAVRQAYGLARHKAVDYATSPFGRFDPVLLGQARKRIAAAKETWSALSGGDANKIKGVTDQFNLVAESLTKLHPASTPLAQAMVAAIDSVAKSGRAPSTELAMEVATAVLYLEAAFQDLDPTDSQLQQRTARLAERLDRVRQGGQPEALEPWMEELYRRVSDRQTMGSVVGELRGTLSELEKLLDQFFRNPKDKGPLRDAPTHLSQMRGVLSVLGLDQASQAVMRMRDTVEEIIVTEVDEEKARAAGTFDKLGNNLGALGFLIDMLNYQPALAKKLFVYDDSNGELKPLMGRAAAEAAPHEAAPAVDDLAFELPAAPAVQAPAPAPVAAQAPAKPAAPVAAPVAAPAPAPVAAAPAEDDGDDELLQIFLEEAREVVGNGLAAIDALGAEPSNVNELTTLRRAFHTLKGSSRMVGLNEFGEAAWSMEQVLNTVLGDQKPASEDLRSLAAEAMTGFGRWIEDIAAHTDSAWKASAFRGPADAMRLEQKRLPITLPLTAQPVEEKTLALNIPAAEEPTIAFEVPAAEPASAPVAAAEAPVAAPAEEPAMSFDLPAAAEPVAAPVAEAAADAAAFDLSFLDAAPPAEAAAPAGAAPIPEPEPAAADPLFDTTMAFQSAPTEPMPLDEPAPPAAEAVEVVEGAGDFDFDFNAEPAPAAPADVSVTEIEGIDFASLSAVSASAEPPAVQPPAQEAPVFELPAFDEPAPEPEPAAPAVAAQAAPVAEPEQEVESESGRDEHVKVIGSLRIGIPLYNVYLNEADEWSRRLSTELSEWALEMNQRVPDSTVGWAHALAGSSATVGFQTLSDVARALEYALEHAQKLAWGTPQHARAFTNAAEEIHRLLHQFAAGFLKEPDTSVIAELQALGDLEIPMRVDAIESGPGALQHFFDEPAAAAEPQIEIPEEPPVQEPPAAAPVVEAAAPVAAPVAAPAAPVFELPPSQPAPVMAQPAVQLESEDDIDVADAIDPDLFPIFEEEAQELMPALGSALRQWSANANDRGARDNVLRHLHTLKGSARLAGALRLGEMAHRLESEVEYLGSENVNPADIEQLLGRYDNLQTRFDALREGGVPAESPVASGFAPIEPAAAPAPAAFELPSFEEPAQPKADAQPQPAQPAAAPVRTALAMPAPLAVTAVRQAANQAVRVRSQLLDRLVNQAGEVMITRSRLEAELKQLRTSLGDLTGNLDRLRTQLRDIELQAETQMQSRLAQSKDTGAGFDPLEFDRFTRVQELTRMMAESVNDVATVQRNIQRAIEATEDDLIAQARQTRELQRDLLRTRMVEFEGISDRLYRVVRLAAKETGKQVKLDITGGSIEMDRGVLDRMTPAFEHLLRNCVAHGIERPEVRSVRNKDATGSIAIHLRQEGNDVSVEFQDDGAGLDLPRIREKALQQGMISPEHQLTDAEAANLIFMPGFSTAQQVTELAGRGIGMDVVRSEVNALGGRIETTTAPGRGTTFKLVLPLTTAVTQVVMIRSGQLAVGVPANMVEIVRRATGKEVEQAYNSGTFEFQGEQLPFFWSGALLQSSARSVEPQGKTLPVVIFRSAAQRVAVHVDEVLGNQEVVVKNLGPQLSRLPGMAGMTVLASGAVVLIYNPVALAQVYGDQARALSADHAQPEVLEQQGAPAAPQVPLKPAAPAIPLVLVVDDSITVRRVTQRLLQREGYRVALASDGLNALEKLAEERPAVVLSDIEMPRMDGFDLARNIRADARLADLPIVMITSRIAEKHREHARELGVNHYLGKPYSEEELLSLVKHYCSAAVAA